MLTIFNFLNNLKNFPFYFISPLNFAIGTAAEQIIVAMRKSKLENKKLIILVPYKIFSFKFDLCNRYIFKELNSENIESSKSLLYKIFTLIFNTKLFILILKSYLFNLKADYPNIGLSLIELHKMDNINENIEEKYNFSNQIISLPKKDEIFFLNLLSNKTNYKNQKIITIHFRDSLYRNDPNRRSYRNSSIKNSYKSIHYLLEKGYFVVRIGNLAKEKFEINHDNFLDYPFSKLVKDKNDILLIKNSSFYIGTNTGLTEVAYLLNIPVLLTNMSLLFEGYPRKKEDRGIYKKIYFKDFQNQITLKEFINLPNKYHHSLVHNTNLITDLKFEENSEEEIFQAVKEYENLFRTDKLNEHSKIQDYYNNLLNIKLIELYKYNLDLVNKNKIVKKKELDEPYKNLRYKIFLNGAISESYLLNCSENEK